MTEPGNLGPSESEQIPTIAAALNKDWVSFLRYSLLDQGSPLSRVYQVARFCPNLPVLLSGVTQLYSL